MTFLIESDRNWWLACVGMAEFAEEVTRFCNSGKQITEPLGRGQK